MIITMSTFFFLKSHNYKLDYKQTAHINVVAVKVGPNYLATKKCLETHSKQVTLNFMVMCKLIKEPVCKGTIPLRIHLPLLPSWLIALLLFSELRESERLSLLSSEPSSDSSFTTSEMFFYMKNRAKDSMLFLCSKQSGGTVKQK